MSQWSSTSRADTFKIKGKRQTGRVKSFSHITIQPSSDRQREKSDVKAYEIDDDAVFGDKNMHLQQERIIYGGKECSLENTATNFSMRTSRKQINDFNAPKNQGFSKRLHELSSRSSTRK